MKRIILLFVGFFFLLQLSFGQKVAITGTVTAKEDGLPIIGASVMEKGTTNGTVTNFDGIYSISVKDGATLVFTYVGMDKQEMKVSGAGKQNVVMKSNSVVMDEVVVTAMGVKQEKKKMNFAVQSLNSDALNEGRSANFVNSLQGKVSGVSVTTAGGSPNSGSQIIIRGISSVNPSQSNQPLFIVDGMQVAGGPSDINPSDIENVTVLKGAAASALYGQEAANGVVMVTTKQGAAGKITTTFNASVQFDTPTRLPKIQSIFAPGSLGFYKPKTGGGWGPLLSEGETTYDNVKNYFKTGVFQKYDIGLSGGTDKFMAYASANYSSNKGIVPNDYLTKYGMLLKGNYKVTNKLTATMLINVTDNTSRGADGISSDLWSTGISSAYQWPINDDITHYKNDDGTVRFRYLSDGDSKKNSPISPLWSRYMDSGENKSTRTILQGSLNYKPIKNFDFTARFGYDKNVYQSDAYEIPKFDDSVILPNQPDPNAPIYSGNTDLYARDLAIYTAYYNSLPYYSAEKISNVNKRFFGNYAYNQSNSQMLTSSVLATYKLELSNNFNIDFLAGSEMKQTSSISTALSGRDFIIPGVYSLYNVSDLQNVADVTLDHRDKRIFGAFGEIRADYKGLASLSVTSRYDWSSTIRTKFNPYYYPSITGGVIFSELFNLANNWFSYGKLRGNWAKVGKDCPPYQYDRKFTQYPTLPDGGYGADPSKSVANRLIPEMSDSWEIGLDTRFFQNKTRLDLAYYSTTVSNQIVTVRVSPTSGYILQTRNEGDITNHGFEATLEQELLKTKSILWSTNVNFGFNRGYVAGLPSDVSEITGAQYGTAFTTAYLHGSTTGISGKDYLRTSDGKVICGTDGYPKINPQKAVNIGNREPDFLIGLSTNFRYKDFSVGMLFDIRKGGDVYNVTGAGLWSSGQHKDLEFYRGRQIVWDGVVAQPDGTYVQNTTPIVLDYTTITSRYVDVNSNFVEDGSYIRMSYLSLAYDFSKLLNKKSALKGIRCSFTGNNLFLLTKYSGSDPQINANTSAGGTGSMGVDNYPVPNTRSFNFTLSANF